MDLELLHSARIGIEDLELDARCMPHELELARRDPPDDREHEAAERIDVSPLRRP